MENRNSHQEGRHTICTLRLVQSNAMVVKTKSNAKKNTTSADKIIQKKFKININLIHNRFHWFDGVIATIRAHDLWDDVQVLDGIDTLCAS